MQAIFIKSILLAAALTGLAAAARQMANNQNAKGVVIHKLTGKDCAWYDTAPICNAKCPAGIKESRRDFRGNGRCCRTGSKVLCCT